MSGRQRAYWTMSSPLAPDYNIAMQQFTNIECTTTTNQHKDSPEDSMKGDAADLDKISFQISCVVTLFRQIVR